MTWSRVKSLTEIKAECDRLRASGKKIVFTNGCFDILHPGHIRYLQSAKELGDHLVVAVNSDRSVQTIKGRGRPIMPEEARAELLSALSSVDGVLIFDEDTPLRVIQCLMPDILVKGGDWDPEKIVGADVVRRAGGTSASIPFVKGYSTTQIINKIRAAR